MGKYELWSRGLVSGSFVGLYWGRGGAYTGQTSPEACLTLIIPNDWTGKSKKLSPMFD